MTPRADSLTHAQTIQPPMQRVLARLNTTCQWTLRATALTLAIATAAQAQLPTAQTQPGQVEPADTLQTTESQIPTAQQPAPAQVSSIVEPPASPAPKPTPFSPVVAGIVDLSADAATPLMGIAHLRPQNLEGLEEDNVGWLESVILPLYVSPGGDHWGWIYEGWLIPAGQAYLAIGRDAGFAMVKPYENLYTFPVLEARDDGWFRVQYTAGGSAWAHTSQLELGETSLTVESWEDNLEAQTSVYFLENGEAQPLRSRPELANNLLSLVAADSLIEPLDFAGDWMRVRVTRPVASCTPLTGASTTEGWMRWRSEQSEPLVWYRPDENC